MNWKLLGFNGEIDLPRFFFVWKIFCSPIIKIISRFYTPYLNVQSKIWTCTFFLNFFMRSSIKNSGNFLLSKDPFLDGQSPKPMIENS